MFKAAVKVFVNDLKLWEESGMQGGRPVFHDELRVKPVQGYRSIMEMTWEFNNGRATWEYGRPITQGKVHVVWRRVGTHRIFTDP